MLFHSDLVSYVYPYDNNGPTQKSSEQSPLKTDNDNGKDLQITKIDNWSYVSQINKDFEDNLNLSKDYQMKKVMSKDINVSGAKTYFSCDSIEKIWNSLNKNDFSKNNGNELFLKIFDHCIFTGIFLDIDYNVTPKNNYMSIHNLIVKRMNILLNKIATIYRSIVKIFINGDENDIEPRINITSASSIDELKISYHCLIKIKQVVFTDIYDIKRIVMEAVYDCILQFGNNFFHMIDEEEKVNGGIKNNDHWVDLSIYKYGGSLRCIYNTKKKNPNRPLIPVQIVDNNDGNILIITNDNNKSLETLFDNLIHVPYLWIKQLYHDINHFYKIQFKPNESTLNHKKNLDSWFEKNLDPLIFGYNQIKIVKSELLFSDSLVHLSEKLSSYIHTQLLSISGNSTKPIYLKKIQHVDPNIKNEYNQTTKDNDYKSFLKKLLLSTNILIFKSNNHYCNIRGSDHKSNNVYYVVDLLKMVWYQSCHDNECISSQKKKIHFCIPEQFHYLIHAYNNDITNISLNLDNNNINHEIKAKEDNEQDEQGIVSDNFSEWSYSQISQTKSDDQWTQNLTNVKDFENCLNDLF